MDQNTKQWFTPLSKITRYSDHQAKTEKYYQYKYEKYKSKYKKISN